MPPPVRESDPRRRDGNEASSSGAETAAPNGVGRHGAPDRRPDGPPQGATRRYDAPPRDTRRAPDEQRRGNGPDAAPPRPNAPRDNGAGAPSRPPGGPRPSGGPRPYEGSPRGTGAPAPRGRDPYNSDPYSSDPYAGDSYNRRGGEPRYAADPGATRGMDGSAARAPGADQRRPPSGPARSGPPAGARRPADQPGPWNQPAPRPGAADAGRSNGPAPEPTRRAPIAAAAGAAAVGVAAAGAAAASPTQRVAHGPDRPLSPSADAPRAYSAAAASAAPAPTRSDRSGAAGSPPPEPPDDRSSGSGGGSGGGGRRRLPRGRTVRRLLVAAVLLAMVLPAAAFVIAYLMVSVPQPGEIQTNQIATILAADGTTELSRVVPPEGNRTDVPIDQVPEYVRTAVLSAEDRNFYNNPGFSIVGFTRAARDQLLGRDNAGGGSTITQQYVKNALVGSAPTIQRKLHELVLSAKMAREWSKDEILAAYLNTIYFGRGAYGIAAASQAYFGKPVNELTLSEGAVLAATIQLPSQLDPESNPEGAQNRWNYVLDGMVDMGALSQTDRDAQIFPTVVPAAQVSVGSPLDSGPNGLIKTQVLAELAAEGIDENVINTEGLQITTSIRPDAQAQMIEAVNTNMQGEPENLRTAAVSIDPRTGAVVAYYGGSDGHGFDYAQSGLQTGSSFKVFALAAALNQGIPLSQQYDSSPLTVHGIEINNVEGASCGTCSIAEALKRSLNTSFYRLELSLDNGPQDIADIAHEAGIARDLPGIGPTLTEPDGAGPNNGIVLGQYQSRVIDMASAYATFAASGMYHKPYFVQRVVTADGRVLLDRGAGDPGQQVIDEDVADNVTSAMEPIAAYSRGHALAGGRPSAAKTGTAQLGDTGNNKDAWMVGFTPSLSTAVWVGTEQSSPLFNYAGASIYGSGLPSDIWKDTMDGILSGTEVESFPTPGSIGGQAGRPLSEPSSSGTGSRSETSQSRPTSEAPPTLQLPPIQLPSLPVEPPVQVPTEVEILPGVTIPIPGAAAPAQNQSGATTPQAATGTGNGNAATENRSGRQNGTGQDAAGVATTPRTGG